MDTFNPQDLASVMFSLHLVADHLHELLAEDVENSLATYDMFIGLAPQFRRQAAQLLRETGEAIQDPVRRERVLRAAEAVAGGAPCSHTEGESGPPTAPQANASDEWQVRKRSGLIGPTRSIRTEAATGPPGAEPPSMPHLDIWDFFPGLAVRIAQDFKDFDGDNVLAGEILHLLEHAYFAYDGGHTLTFREKVIRLAEIAPENELVIENPGNAWFEPLPERECLRACFELIDRQWDLLLKNFPEKLKVEHAAEIRAEIDACGRWLNADGDRGSAPVCVTGPWAVRAFPVDDRRTANLALRINFLFAGIVRVA